MGGVLIILKFSKDKKPLEHHQLQGLLRFMRSNDPSKLKRNRQPRLKTLGSFGLLVKIQERGHFGHFFLQ